MAGRATRTPTRAEPKIGRPGGMPTISTVAQGGAQRSEQMVLSVIGDGSDDQQAADRLGLSPYTVNTHRKAIMAKLKLHHKGQLMLHALQHGYIWVSAQQIQYPGFQRRLLATAAVAKVPPTERASA